MNRHPECLHLCMLAEHQGYSTCMKTGECAWNQPAPPSQNVVRRSAGSRRTEPEEGCGAALLLMLAIVLACVWMGD
jgi:hypothetical protein